MSGPAKYVSSRRDCKVRLVYDGPSTMKSLDRLALRRLLELLPSANAMRAAANSAIQQARRMSRALNLMALRTSVALCDSLIYSMLCSLSLIPRQLSAAALAVFGLEEAVCRFLFASVASLQTLSLAGVNRRARR